MIGSVFLYIEIKNNLPILLIRAAPILQIDMFHVKHVEKRNRSIFS